MITLQDVQLAAKNIELVAAKVPFVRSNSLSHTSSCEIFLKKCNLQNTGAFKIRGAFNKICKLSEAERQRGIIAASAGNHAQGVAFSASYFAAKAIIVMPEATPLLKVNGVRSYGAEVILHGLNYDEAYAYAVEYAERHALTFVHPFADDDVIAGQGTIALEMLESEPKLDYIVVPVGGGGLISGIAIAAKEINPSIKVIGVSAAGAPAMYNSFCAKTPMDSLSVRTIADGIAVRDTSPKMVELLLKYVDEMVVVDDGEIANAILFLMERHKIVVEGAGAAAVAAVMHKKISLPNNSKVGVVLSGGNIDVSMLSLIIEKGLLKSHRKMKLIVTLIDKPGSLMRLTECLAKVAANIVHIDYDRVSTSLEYGDANIIISVETKGEQHQEDIKRELANAGYKFSVTL